jgi:hypothetical protein
LSDQSRRAAKARSETSGDARTTRLFAPGAEIADRYLNLLEQTLTGAILKDVGFTPHPSRPDPILADAYDPENRALGIDWPRHAHTMIGTSRLRVLRGQIEQVLDEGIPGDFIETGVWRGGVCIFMRAILAAHGVKDRRVWVADSFAGLPPPNPDQYPADRGSELHNIPILAVALEEVKRNFAKYGLLDEQVEFLPGWFRDTLPRAPIKTLAILRLDGDLYESTIQALESLYDKVSRGGYVIIDDYIIRSCRQAVHDFRARRRIANSLEQIDSCAVCWRA